MAKIKAKKSTVENIVDTKKVKIKKIKKERYVSETEEEIRRLLLILVVITVFVVGMYFISTKIVEKRENNTSNTSTTDTTINVDYSVVSVGTILNRPYNEYYVLVYDKEDEDAMYYDSLVTAYNKKKDKEKLYTCDLGNTLNSSYKSSTESGNKDAKKISELSFGKVTLLKIKKGSIVSYIEDISKIETELN